MSLLPILVLPLCRTHPLENASRARHVIWNRLFSTFYFVQIYPPRKIPVTQLAKETSWRAYCLYDACCCHASIEPPEGEWELELKP